MTDPNPRHLALASLIRDALTLSDNLRLFDVSIGLDQALNRLVDLDPSGTIEPMPFDLDEHERATSSLPCFETADDAGQEDGSSFTTAD